MTVAPQRQSLTFEDIDDITRALRLAGHRVSAAARLVLDALFVAGGPVSAERIAEGLGGRLAPLELTSVYRNLERLEQLGAVSHVHVGHGPGLYALVCGGDREYLVCERCGRVTAMESAALDSLRETVRRSFGYHVRFSHFPIHGHCADCVSALTACTAEQASPRPHRKGGPMPAKEHEHEHPSPHEHRHGKGIHSHSHSHIEHDHSEHEHEHSHGDRVHSHPHIHQSGLEHEHGHGHDPDQPGAGAPSDPSAGRQLP